jgi:hypothetical protein
MQETVALPGPVRTTPLPHQRHQALHMPLHGWHVCAAADADTRNARQHTPTATSRCAQQRWFDLRTTHPLTHHTLSTQPGLTDTHTHTHSWIGGFHVLSSQINLALASNITHNQAYPVARLQAHHSHVNGPKQNSACATHHHTSLQSCIHIAGRQHVHAGDYQIQSTVKPQQGQLETGRSPAAKPQCPRTPPTPTPTQ